MEHKDTSYRRGPALAAAAAFGLATTVMLAPAAHAGTENDRAAESASTTVMAEAEGTAAPAGAENAAEPAREALPGTGEEVAAETGEQATAGTSGQLTPEAGDESLDVEAGPAEAESAGQTAGPGNSEPQESCVDGATGDQQAAGTDTATVADTGLDHGTAQEGPDDAAGLPEAASGAAGPVTDPGCAATAPDQADNGPGTGDEDETQLPVGGVDAGLGEAAGQNMVLPIATAGAAAAAVGLGAYTLVRRRRSDT
jgi:hypothetical protein